MNRLTAWNHFSPHIRSQPNASLNVGALVKRNITIKSTPVSHTFGRGYGFPPQQSVIPSITSLLSEPTRYMELKQRGMAINKNARTKAEKEIEEENLKPKSFSTRPAKESLESIAQDLVRLSEKEIKTIMEADANSIQTERGKTWLEQSNYALRPVPELKDSLMLTKKMGNTTITVTFKKEYEEQLPENAEEEQNNEEGEVQSAEDIEKEFDEKETEGQEEWIRSGDELPDREDFPTKHSLEIDIRIEDRDGKPKGKLHLYGFAGLDDRLYINEMLCETGSTLTDDKKSYCVFDDLSDPMQDRIYDYLDELGVDDRMAHFVKSTVVREKKESDIAFLNNFKEILKP
eukprot:TRINITY_DN6748_c0_g1_i1.p1 TRINITY_DN6748_c0_g1~~TRINITY_DN6748_c0_g1_i1.p1  ORF type:complete len:346 (-),score=107.31 TRINITY_DN6748_c0_g1_i1:102-1139(-)